jgi:hypothetical protein
MNAVFRLHASKWPAISSHTHSRVHNREASTQVAPYTYFLLNRYHYATEAHLQSTGPHPSPVAGSSCCMKFKRSRARCATATNTKTWAYGDRRTSGLNLFSKELTKCNLDSVEYSYT